MCELDIYIFSNKKAFIPRVVNASTFFQQHLELRAVFFSSLLLLYIHTRQNHGNAFKRDGRRSQFKSAETSAFIFALFKKSKQLISLFCVALGAHPESAHGSSSLSSDKSDLAPPNT
jgi:hypothetical protein